MYGVHGDAAAVSGGAIRGRKESYRMSMRNGRAGLKSPILKHRGRTRRRGTGRRILRMGFDDDYCKQKHCR